MQSTLLTLCLGCLSLLAVAPAEYATEDIRVDFGGAYSQRAVPGKTVYGSEMPQPEATVDFCAWQPQPAHVQQVMRPENGYLCEMHVMPAQTAEEILPLLERQARKKRPDHAQTFRVESVVIGGHRVVRWRFQAGKTRLDHFVVTGKKHNYLFVSSPYGSNGAIEEIIKRVRLLP